jgi:hypothetical protein
MITDDRPLLAFLIPFASRKVKRNWELASAHLRQTLRSIHNSSNPNYCVIVAGHEPPVFDVSFDSRFHFLSLNHSLPSHDDYHVSLVRDKLTKIAAAWSYAKQTWNPRYVMKLDADDLISSKLVAWLDKAAGEAGYLIKHGWVWRSGSPLVERTEYLDRTCGSCLLIRSDLADRNGPFLTELEGAPLDEASSAFAARDPYSLIPGSGVTTLLLNDTHQRCAAQFAYLGHELSGVPFQAVVYRTSNPDSTSRFGGFWRAQCTLRMLVGRVRRTRLITQRLRKEFMLG